MKEQLKHRQEFENWVALGENRSYRRLAKTSLYTRDTLCRWSHLFSWEERLKERNRKDQTLTHEAPRSESDTKREVETLMGRVKSMIDNTFKLDTETGVLKPTFEIKTTTDFVRIIQVQKELILLHKEVSGEGGMKGKDSGLKQLANVMNVYLEGATDEQKLNLLKSAPTVGGGTDSDTGTVSDADFTEVSDGADKEED